MILKFVFSSAFHMRLIWAIAGTAQNGPNLPFLAHVTNETDEDQP